LEIQFATGIIMILLLIGMLALAFDVQPVNASGTIYIRADGSVDPPSAPIERDGDIYTFTGDISEPIVVERDNITIDGNGHILQSAGGGYGITLSGRRCVTIKNAQIKLFDFGIWLNSSSSNTVSGNNITNNAYGLLLEFSSCNNTISGNNVTANNYDGVLLFFSSNNSIEGNIFVHDGLRVFDSSGNFVEDNSVNGKPLIYLERTSNLTINYAGQVILVDCDGILVENLNLSYTDAGIQLWKTSNTKIKNNTITNSDTGIELWSSSNNTIQGNSVTANNYDGVLLNSSSNNKIYHNNFINNTDQVYMPYKSTNIWDDGYPSGGNYWSDYNGTDLYSGSYQNEAGSDGIGDVAYDIDADNTDNFPLMAPFSMFDAGSWDGIPYNVDVISNSTVSDFQINRTQRTISFNITGPDDTLGFCRVTIPNIIVQELWHSNYTVLLNGELWTFRNWTDNTHTWLYFAYQHSPREVVVIIPEFQLLLIPLLLILATLTSNMLRKYTQKET